MRVGLVACAARKLDRATFADTLYDSDLFRKASSYARDAYDAWFILSAKHGLLRPSDVIEPYDVTLNRMATAERDAWGAMVDGQVHEWGLCRAVLSVHAGRRYCEPLWRNGLSFATPLAGLGIGQQLAWYKARGY